MSENHSLWHGLDGARFSANAGRSSPAGAAKGRLLARFGHIDRRIEAVQAGQVTKTFLSRYITPETRRPGKSPDNTVAKKPSLKARCHKPVSGAGARNAIAAWATYRLSSLDFPLGDLPAFFFDARPRVEAVLFLPPSFSPLGCSAVDAPSGMGSAPIAAHSGSW